MPGEREIRAYLLAMLPDFERSRIEQELLTQPETREILDAIEVDLIDDYLTGDLSPEEIRHFEQDFLTSPARCEKLAFAAAFLRSLPTPRPPLWRRLIGKLRGPGLRPLAFGAVAAASAGIMLLLVHSWARRPEAGQRPASQSVAHQPSGAPANIPAFVLTPGVLRGEGGPRALAIPAGIALIRLQGDMPRLHRTWRYRARLRTLDGDEIWNAAVTPGGAHPYLLDVLIPTRTLPEGDYLMTVEGAPPGKQLEPMNSYLFRVERP